MWIVVINPVAGQGKGATVGAQVTGLLTSKGERYTLVTAASADLLSISLINVLRTQKCRGVLCVGGDGLVHLVLQIAVKEKVPVAIFPAGTGNDFARAIGVAHHPIPELLEHILTTDPVPTDLGLVDSEWFGAILSSGFDSVVNEKANTMEWPSGPAKYNAAILLELPRFKPIKYEITLDNHSVTTEAMLIAVGNGSSYGGGMKVCAEANLHDGLFDVVILRPVSKFEFLKVFPKVYSGSHLSHPAIDIYRSRTVVLNSSATAYADGERIGQLPVRAECVKDAALVWSL
jgi:diacylglycerol kinase (ATP)